MTRREKSMVFDKVQLHMYKQVPVLSQDLMDSYVKQNMRKGSHTYVLWTTI